MKPTVYQWRKWLPFLVVLMGLVVFTNAMLHSPAVIAADPPTPQPTDSRTDVSNPRGEPTQQTVQNNSNTPLDYCPSSGGATTFENISNVGFTSNANGSYKLDVDVFIANPNGCSAGEPCPEYDQSPEYVNVWIDWNGDEVWEASEQVMDVALTGYLSINYGGTMNAVAQVTPPGKFTDTTMLRANLGWSFDPNDPCTPSWQWGNVVDQQVDLNPPEITEIKVEGSKDVDHPMTTYDVKTEAVLNMPPGYSVEKVTWSGDLTPGEGNPYTYKPDKDTHGKKKIKATLTYKNDSSGLTGQVSKVHEFKLFFEKKGDVDGDSDPNWFEYWGTDGAVPGLTNPLVTYDSSKGAGSYGAWSPASDKVELGPAAAETHYPGGLTIEGTTYGNVKGIDSVAEVIAHELRHRTTIKVNWGAGGSWVGITDTDFHSPTVSHFDYLPDTYEAGFGTDKTKVDSKDLEHIKSAVYRFYGDNEFDAIVAGHGQTGTADKDWANPGKQSTPPFAVTHAPTLLEGKTSGLGNLRASSHQFTAGLSELAQLTGNYSDMGVDEGGDSAYDLLRLNVGLNVIEAGNYNIIGWLQDSGGNDVAWAQHTTNLDAGSQQIELDFDGKLIQQHGANGPYSLARVEVRTDDHDDLVDEATDAHTTSNYNANEFSPPAVTFNDSYSDMGQDDNSDALYDWLNVIVGVQVNTSGSYSLVGWLYDAEGNPVPNAAASTTFSDSGNQTLAFDGRLIRWARANGPYTIRYLEVRDTADERIVFNAEAYTTAAYTYTEFQGSNTSADATTFSDQGVDVDEDSDFDYLQVQFQINSEQAGRYHLLAALQDSTGGGITDIARDITLEVGVNDIVINFISGPIYAQGIDGPYRVASVTLLDSEGTIVDNLPLAHLTNAYSASDFSPALISLLDSYEDYPADADEDGTYDHLNIDLSVTPGNSGVIVAQGFLVDSNGTIIEEVTRNTEMEAGSAQVLTLPFSATLILENGVDGPFELQNLLVYHTGDPSQAVSRPLAHRTAAYDYETLEINESMLLYLPTILR